jgi:2-hydroxy-6-oxonona-2,4-dienedioate hydrolase
MATEMITRSMMGEKFVDVDGIRTRYYEAGQGEPLLLFHGGHFGASDNVDLADNWGLNWPGFSQHFHVFAMDKLGQGFTDNPKRDEDYSMQAVVRHAADFIRAMGLDRYHLVGHSRGGYLVTRLTLENQAQVRTLTIVDSSTTAPGENIKRGPLLAGAPKPLLSRESIAWVTAAFSDSAAHVTDDWLDVRERVAKLPKTAEAIAKMSEQDGGAGLSREVFLPGIEKQKAETLEWIKDGNLKVPTLLVWGKNDPSALLAGGVELFDIVSGSTAGAQMHIFNHAGHYSYREHPNDFVEVVSSFIHCQS